MELIVFGIVAAMRRKEVLALRWQPATATAQCGYAPPTDLITVEER